MFLPSADARSQDENGIRITAAWKSAFCPTQIVVAVLLARCSVGPRYKVKQPRGANAEALIQYRSSVLRATEDVEDALNALVQSESRRDEIASGIVSLQRVKDLSEQSYKAGVIPLTDVLDDNRQLLVAKDDLASTRESAARTAVASFRALGGGWSP